MRDNNLPLWSPRGEPRMLRLQPCVSTVSRSSNTHVAPWASAVAGVYQAASWLTAHGSSVEWAHIGGTLRSRGKEEGGAAVAASVDMNNSLSKLGWGKRTGAYEASSSGDAAEASGGGFTSVIRHLPLRGWLSWIHANQSDATLRVRTMDGGNGFIWCIAGSIIDAEWGTLAGEPAVKEMLSLSSGAVTIDFDAVQRPARISTRTRDLLNGLDAPPALASRQRLFGLCLLGAAAVLAFSFGRIWASSDFAESRTARESAHTEQVKSGLLPPPLQAPAAAATPELPAPPRELPPIPFMAIEVSPTAAEIWLDQKLAGTGRVQLATVHDGTLHELRFVAPGYEPKSLFFRDTPPTGRVQLEPVAALAVEPNVVIGKLGGASAEGSRASERPSPRRRSQPGATRLRVTDDRAAPADEAPPATKTPHVQVIEVETPKVQVID
jgi:hypothetical protein